MSRPRTLAAFAAVNLLVAAGLTSGTTENKSLLYGKTLETE